MDDGDDEVDAIMRQWARELPHLDASRKAVTARIVRLADVLHERFDAAFARHGLRRSTYSALAALRRAGEPFELTPRELGARLFITAGGLTPILDKLEAEGLVERRADPSDRRKLLIVLTKAGRERIEPAMADHVAAEHEVLAGLGERERARLAAGLKRLLSSLEG